MVNIMRDTQIRLCLTLTVLLTTSACSGLGSIITQRCPAIAPVALQCETWTFDKEAFPESVSPIERLQAKYQETVALLYDAERVVQECGARDRVWTQSWEECDD